MKHSDLKIGMKVKRVNNINTNFVATSGVEVTVNHIGETAFNVVEDTPIDNEDGDWYAEYFEPVIEVQEKSITNSKDKKYKTRCGYPARILCTDFKKNNTPILSAVEYKDGTEYVIAYTQEGICPKDSDFNLIEVTPYSDFKKDDKVMVSDDGTHWFPYHFAQVMCGLPYTFYGGKTSFSSDESDIIDWNYCRKPTQEELEGD